MRGCVRKTICFFEDAGIEFFLEKTTHTIKKKLGKFILKYLNNVRVLYSVHCTEHTYKFPVFTPMALSAVFSKTGIFNSLSHKNNISFVPYFANFGVK